MSQLLTVSAIADRLDVTESGVRRWLLTGKLIGTKPQGRYNAPWLVEESELDTAIEEGRINPDEKRGRPRLLRNS